MGLRVHKFRVPAPRAEDLGLLLFGIEVEDVGSLEPDRLAALHPGPRGAL